jgi:hypothetical protein
MRKIIALTALALPLVIATIALIDESPAYAQGISEGEMKERLADRRCPLEPATVNLLDVPSTCGPAPDGASLRYNQCVDRVVGSNNLISRYNAFIMGVCRRSDHSFRSRPAPSGGDSGASDLDRRLQRLRERSTGNKDLAKKHDEQLKQDEENAIREVAAKRAEEAKREAQARACYATSYDGSAYICCESQQACLQRCDAEWGSCRAHGEGCYFDFKPAPSKYCYHRL